ncbi:MAG: single-stranded DNA-binding protein [Rikenellaceae bacterium]|jgi:single-strand DNA-binding protein|nr:single-stranded DNA-binding protein [Rikenellaceae bacterium]
MVNKVILIGNVGADPDVRSLEGGVKVARIRLATTERSYNRQTQETKEFTEWHSVTLWRSLADVADRFVKKGSQIYIEGSIRSREWSDETGVKRYAVEIVANEMKLLGRRPDGAQTASGASVPAPAPAPVSAQASAPAGGHSYAATAQTPAPAPAVSSAPQDDPDDLPF